MAEWLGYQWLAERYGIVPVQAFRTDSVIAKSRTTVREDGYVHEAYPAAAKPVDTFSGHLGLALKHEGVHLEFLARLFAVVPAAELEHWIAAEPNGQYARRAGFFYEWLTGADRAVQLRATSRRPGDRVRCGGPAAQRGLVDRLGKPRQFRDRA